MKPARETRKELKRIAKKQIAQTTVTNDRKVEEVIQKFDFGRVINRYGRRNPARLP